VVTTQTKIHIMVFWVVTPCSDVVGYHRLWESWGQQSPAKR